MSIEAWGDEDPNDSLCAAPECMGRACFGSEACSDHLHWVECDACADLVDPEFMVMESDSLGDWVICPECAG